MQRILLGALLLLPIGSAFAGNYATCLLDKLPGVENQAATSSAVQMCQTDYPGGLTNVPQGDELGFFASYRSGDECTLEESKGTRFVPAVQLIRSACHKLYDTRQLSAKEACEIEKPGPWCKYR